MQRNPGKWLEDILTEGGDAAEFLAGRSAEEYVSNKAPRAMVERKLYVVGEAVTQLKNGFPEVAERLPNIREIVSFRNLLTHGYFALDDARVYDIVINSLPELLAAVGLIVNDYPD